MCCVGMGIHLTQVIFINLFEISNPASLGQQFPRAIKIILKILISIKLHKVQGSWPFEPMGTLDFERGLWERIVTSTPKWFHKRWIKTKKGLLQEAESNRILPSSHLLGSLNFWARNGIIRWLNKGIYWLKKTSPIHPWVDKSFIGMKPANYKTKYSPKTHSEELGGHQGKYCQTLWHSQYLLGGPALNVLMSHRGVVHSQGSRLTR